jgi:hypothetical protein
MHNHPNFLSRERAALLALLKSFQQQGWWSAKKGGHSPRAWGSFLLFVLPRGSEWPGTWRRTLSSIKNALTVFVKSAG